MNISFVDCDLNEWKLDFFDLIKNNELNILYFYPKDDTPWCTVEANEFSQFEIEFNKINTKIYWVSKDSIESHKKFIKKYDITYTLLSDLLWELHDKYSVIWEKNLYWKKIISVIRSTFLLNSKWEILKEWRNVRAKWHALKVLEFIKSLK